MLQFIKSSETIGIKKTLTKQIKIIPIIEPIIKTAIPFSLLLNKFSKIDIIKKLKR